MREKQIIGHLRACFLSRGCNFVLLSTLMGQSMQVCPSLVSFSIPERYIFVPILGE